jgi:hypothetical protein
LCHKNACPRFSTRVHVVFVTQETILFIFYFFLLFFYLFTSAGIDVFLGIFFEKKNATKLGYKQPFFQCSLFAQQGITTKAISIMVPKGAQPGDLIAARCFFFYYVVFFFQTTPLEQQGITTKAISVMVPEGSQPGDLIAAR